MTTNPLFTPTADGTAYDIQPAGVLLILADTVYDSPSDTPPIGRARAQAMLDAILSAAAGGFTQFDIHATLLSRNEVSPRVKTMAIQACEAAGTAALGKIFGAMRNTH